MGVLKAMTGIVGFTDYAKRYSDRLSKSILVKMVKSVSANSHQYVEFSNGHLQASVIPSINSYGYSYATNENGTLNAVVCGNLYEFEKEKKMLQNEGHGFKMGNSAEFLVHGYEAYGIQIFQKLNGSFSAVIWDKNERRLLLVTDRFGSRPLYYAIKDGELIFSSHVRAILQYPNFPKRLNELALVKFLMFGKIGILGEDTWFEGIKLIPPACIFHFSPDEIKIDKYWDLEYAADLSEDEAVNKLVRTFIKAVNTRAESIAEGLFVMLSGGLDSRSVLGALNNKNRDKTVAVTFGSKYSGDVIIARKVASKLGVKHMVLKYDPDELAKYAEETVYLSDGQDTVSVAFIPYVARKLKSLGFKVYLQGFMFDLLLGGSFMHRKIFRCKSDTDLINLLYESSYVFTLSELKKILNPNLNDKIKVVTREFMDLVKKSKGDYYANKSDYFFINTRVRRYTLMGSVINRHFFEELLPTIDNEVIDVIRRIPPKLRVKHGIYRKFLMQLSLELSRIPYQKTLLPPFIPQKLWVPTGLIKRAINVLKKFGLKFEHEYFDFNEALRKCPSWRELIANTLFNEESLIYKQGYLNKDKIEELVNEHINGKNYGEKLAFLMTTELILRLFLKEN